jgi:hypothetical protein
VRARNATAEPTQPLVALREQPAQGTPTQLCVAPFVLGDALEHGNDARILGPARGLVGLDRGKRLAHAGLDDQAFEDRV